MPTAQSSRTSCRISASQACASLPHGVAQAQDGNECAGPFSIGWPLRFESRTTNPADPCYVGRLVEKARKPQQHPRPDPKAKWIPPDACRIKAGCNGWRVWRLLIDNGPMKTNDIARELDLINTAVADCSSRLVKAGCIKTERLEGVGRQAVYSIGSTPVVEV